MREALEPLTLEFMSRRIPFDHTQGARALRKNATKHERKLWGILSRLRPKFTRQLPIGPYTADFACRQAKLVVELDGSQHADSKHDHRRDSFLEQEGWSILRIWNNEVDENPDGVFQAIVNRAAECLGGTHPQPLPFQGGEATAADRLEHPQLEATRGRVAARQAAVDD